MTQQPSLKWIFRSLIILQWFILIFPSATAPESAVGERLSEWITQSWLHLVVFGGGFCLLVAGALSVHVGFFLLRPWSRVPYTLLAIGAVALAFLEHFFPEISTTTETPLDKARVELARVAEGVVLALAWASPLAARFGQARPKVEPSQREGAVEQ